MKVGESGDFVIVIATLTTLNNFFTTALSLWSTVTRFQTISLVPHTHFAIMYFTAISIAALITSIQALTITSPSQGQILDPTQPITVTWTTSSGDPSTFDLLTSDGSFISDTRVARSVSASAGSYIIPANSVQSYGTQFSVRADGPDGNHLATSGTFTLSVGSGYVVNGQTTLVTAQTFTGTPAPSQAASASQTGNASGTDSNNASATATGSPDTATASGSATESSTVLSGSRTGFSTSTTSGVSRTSSAGASSTSASSATTSANAQPRLASGSQIVLSGAGLIAGLAALLA